MKFFSGWDIYFWKTNNLVSLNIMDMVEEIDNIIKDFNMMIVDIITMESVLERLASIIILSTQEEVSPGQLAELITIYSVTNTLQNKD